MKKRYIYRVAFFAQDYLDAMGVEDYISQAISKIDAFRHIHVEYDPPILLYPSQETIGAVDYLRRYQDWRTGEDDRTMTEAGIEPKNLTAAIDQILYFFDSGGLDRFDEKGGVE